LLFAALVAPSGCTALPPPANELTQVSTYPALQAGQYDEDVLHAELARKGNFGIDTFDGMDGEMIALDGAFYRARRWDGDPCRRYPGDPVRHRDLLHARAARSPATMR
jgi:hypothetical protein